MRPMDAGQRLRVEHVLLALVLPGVAGAVNASGFLVVGFYTSHMTGTVARIGDEIAARHTNGALAAFGFMILFMLGAVVSTLLVETSARAARARYAAPLLLQAIVLATYASFARNQTVEIGWNFALGGLLCFSMGMQNALVTKISGAVIRTTHVTGLVTDIGIELVRLGLWVRGETRKRPWLQWPGVASRIAWDIEWRRLRLHLSVLTAFMGGAIIGPQLFMRLGQGAMILPCGVLIGLAIFDYIFGIHGDTHVPMAGADSRLIHTDAHRNLG